MLASPKLIHFLATLISIDLKKKSDIKIIKKKKGVKENEIENIKKKERGKASENINSK